MSWYQWALTTNTSEEGPRFSLEVKLHGWVLSCRYYSEWGLLGSANTQRQTAGVIQCWGAAIVWRFVPFMLPFWFMYFENKWPQIRVKDPTWCNNIVLNHVCSSVSFLVSLDTSITMHPAQVDDVPWYCHGIHVQIYLSQHWLDYFHLSQHWMVCLKIHNQAIWSRTHCRQQTVFGQSSWCTLIVIR